MCIGIPARLLHRDGSSGLCRDHRGKLLRIDLLPVGEQPEGTWLMTFLGSARAVIQADEAERIGAALDALQTLLDGAPVDLDAAFADLVDSEPVLPAGLTGEHP